MDETYREREDKGDRGR